MQQHSLIYVILYKQCFIAWHIQTILYVNNGTLTYQSDLYNILMKQGHIKIINFLQWIFNDVAQTITQNSLLRHLEVYAIWTDNLQTLKRII